jgi:prephenate dehydrogenase
MEPEFIGLVGAKGRMGSLFARILSEAGYRVRTADAKDGPIDWDAIASCEVILLAVPMTAVQPVLNRLGPLTRPDGATIDLCSLKEEPLRSMRRHCRGETVGCHPLFGPTVESLRDQLVFLSPGEQGGWFSWWRSFLQGEGARIVEMSARDHDRLMARVQVLRHMMIFSFGLSLSRLGFDLDKELPLAGSWFGQLMDMLGVQLDQDLDMYPDIALGNKEGGMVFDEFVRAASDLGRCVAERDRESLTGLIAEVGEYIRGNSALQLDASGGAGYIRQKGLGGKPCAC